LKHDCCICCDDLRGIEKSALTHYVGALSLQKILQLNDALRVALELEEDLVVDGYE
jgi:mRNA-degrading endonuclease toxin of MazEF toxin-antitoxin module